MDSKEEMNGDTNKVVDLSEKLPNSSVSVDDDSQMKQIDVGTEGGRRKEVAPIGVDDGDKKNINGVDLLVKKGVNNQAKSRDKKQKGIDLQPTDDDDHLKHLMTEKQRRKKMKSLFTQLETLLPTKRYKANMTTIIDETVDYIQALEKNLHDLELKKLERLASLSPNTNVTPLIHQQMHTANANSSTMTDQQVLTAAGSSLANNSNSSSTQSDNVVPSPKKYTPFPFHLRSQPFFKTWETPNVTLDMCGLEAHFSICSLKKRGLLTAISGVLVKRKIDVLRAQIDSDESKIMIEIHVRVNLAPDELLLRGFPHEELFKQAALEIMYWANSRSSYDA